MSYFGGCIAVNDQINMTSETSLMKVVNYILCQILSKKEMLPRASYICLRYQMILYWKGKLLFPYTRRLVWSWLSNHLGKDRLKYNRLQIPLPPPPNLFSFGTTLLSTLEISPEGSLDISGLFVFHFSVFQYVLHFYLICTVFDCLEGFIYLFIYLLLLTICNLGICKKNPCSRKILR